MDQFAKSTGVIVIFGASGDLTQRKLLPAIGHLNAQGLLPHYKILGVARDEMQHHTFRQLVCQVLPEKAQALVQDIYYHAMDVENRFAYETLKARIRELQAAHGLQDNILFYLSTPPDLYYVIPQYLAQIGLNRQVEHGFKRLVIEKPFGHDQASAECLNSHLKQFYRESQLFRIDHYLGKETVQNLLVLRFANAMFEPLWNAQYIENIQIYANESLGVGSRGAYYEQNGVLKDMVQNHLLQLLALVAMEPPAKINAYSIRNETLKVLQSIRRWTDPKQIASNVVVGQYIEGCIQGNYKNAYRQSDNVAADSITPTFVAMRLFVDSWRWQGVPFYLRTGKRLACRASEIVINFKKTPHPFFSKVQQVSGYQNQLVIRIQPDEGIKLTFAVKQPGAGFKTHEVDMGFFYNAFSQQTMPEAYERLILDALQGDGTLFARHDAVEACWHIIDPIVQHFQKVGQQALEFYPSGSFGPAASDTMLADYQHQWRNPSSQFNISQQARKVCHED